MSRDRDHILEQALKHELRTGETPVTAAPALRSFSEGGCLDAETLAAWEDGGLDASAMELAEIHLSTCARCQALAATMARAVPATPVKSGEPFRLWKWWLAPIAAATAAVTIWMVVPAEREAAVAPPAEARTAQQGSRPSEESQIAQPDAKASRIAPERAATDAAPAPAGIAPQKQRDELADRMEQRADAPAAPQKPIDVTLGRVQQRADATAPAAEPEDRRKRQENEAKKEDADTSKLMRENTVAAAETAAAAPPATAPPPAAAPAPAAPRAAVLQKDAGFAPVPVEIISPDPMSRWRIVATGVERSEDGARSWVPVRARGAEIITGGTSPARRIAWLVGRSGLVLVTADGSTFARVDLPERADIASIAANDARSAAVTTADGRTFRTDDSGRTWRRD